jgi:hypothetical protein
MSAKRLNSKGIVIVPAILDVCTTTQGTQEVAFICTSRGVHLKKMHILRCVMLPKFSV